jgi:large subunit ribosomal protein L24
MAKKFGSPLSTELRGKYPVKAVKPVKGDSVKIVRGGFEGIEGKVTGIDTKRGKLFIEGVTREKIAGGKTSPFPVDPSKVVITTLNLDDKVRRAHIERERDEEGA